jgi:hypothetical protein
MRRIEDFMNWLTDMDWGWQPVVSWRPPKDRDIDSRLIFKLSLLFGCIPSLIVTLGFALEHMRTLTRSQDMILAIWGCGFIVLAPVFFFVVYKFTFAWFWNRRARRLRNDEHARKAA